jgi:transcription antitermination factor NusG
MRASFAALKAFMRANPERRPGGPPQPMPTGREYDVGDEVEILDGPFSGQRAKVQKIRANVADVLLSFGSGCGASGKFPLDNLGNLR